MNAFRLRYNVRSSLICEANLLCLFMSVWDWLSSATVINICISIVLAWLNTNSSISGLAGQFPFCFKTNIHTYWCLSSSESGLKHCLWLSFCLLENITSVFGFHILSFFYVCSFIPFCIFDMKYFHHQTTVSVFSNTSDVALGMELSVCRFYLVQTQIP